MSVRAHGEAFEVRVEYRGIVPSRTDAIRIERMVRGAIDKARDHIAFGLSPCITIREGTDAFLSYQRSFRKNARGTLSDHRRAMAFWADALGGASRDIALDRITIDSVDGAIAMLGGSHAPGTVNKYIGTLRRFAVWAVKKKRVPPGIRMDWMEFERVRVPRRSVPVLTKHEFRSIMKAWPDGGKHVALVLWLMAITGARPEALLSLTWADIHREKNGGGFIRFKRLKGGNLEIVAFRPSSMIARILDDAADFFKRTRGRAHVSRAVRVFVPCRRGHGLDAWSVQAFCNAVRFHADRIGATGFTAYAVRHSVMTWLARDNVADDMRKNFAGHTTTAMQAVYVHTSGVDAESVRETVSEWLSPTYAIVASRKDVDDPDDHPTIPEGVVCGGCPIRLEPIVLDDFED